MLEAEQG